MAGASDWCTKVKNGGLTRGVGHTSKLDVVLWVLQAPGASFSVSLSLTPNHPSIISPVGSL